MEIRTSKEFNTTVAKLCKKNKHFGQKINNILRILANFPNHPSLRLHKLRSTEYTSWSISVNTKTRILFVYKKYGILLVKIGSHDQVY